jgi:putative heme-binding domain-containing protein
VSEILILAMALLAAAQAPPASRFRLPPGVAIEKVAGEPLVRYPLFACFDDRGRLFVAEGTGKNLPGPEIAKLKLGKITLLEDTDGDGRFDSTKTFADGFIFPQGVLWHDGVVYVCSPPALWRLKDTDGDGRADQREEWIGRFGYSGNGCDIHGPFLGPDGWIYWTDGRHGYRVETREGTCLEGEASRIWRCRIDGTGIERICGGAFDNPVELAFTTAGDLIGTMDQGPGDALLHYVEGGVYPRADLACVNEFPKTGPLLTAVAQFSPALPPALCGLVRLRSEHFGAEFKDTLLTTQFNVHRVQQHILVRDGATFRATHKDFLVSTDYNFHPTDVLEDADGSLIVVDMGAWFNYGCPTAKIARPEVTGSIYRIRRVGAAPIEDPWGKSLDLESSPPPRLAELLADPRPKVQDRAVEQLVKRGAEAVPPLARLCRRDDLSVDIRRRALWALGRIAAPSAREAVCRALDDKDPGVVQVAAHCLGLERDGEATTRLMRSVVEDSPWVRLKAAEALGRLGRAQAVPALLESFRRAGGDRFLEHALIYALIRIADREGAGAALQDPNPAVRRAALIALDQMANGRLTREALMPLLDSDDPSLQETALEILSRHQGWAKDARKLVGEWLSEARLSAERRRSLTGALLAFSREEAIQRQVAGALSDPGTPPENRLLLLEVVARCRLEPLPAAWREAMSAALGSGDPRLQRAVVTAVRARGLNTFDEPLARIVADTATSAELRLAALECVAPRLDPVTPQTFEFLSARLSEDADPLLRVGAARALGACRLSSEQLIRLSGHLENAGPLLIPLLAPAYAKDRRADVGLSFVAALKKSPGAEALTADDLRGVLQAYAEEVHAAAEPLLERRRSREETKEAYLAELLSRISVVPGNPERGREVFFSAKVGCSACHPVGERGGRAGPDLSRIGALRQTRDLLEAIVFPSSTIAPDYRQYMIVTRDGRVLTGALVRESADVIHLRTAQLEEISVARGEVAQLKMSPLSIMPEGLEKAMTAEELSDLLEFLCSRR